MDKVQITIELTEEQHSSFSHITSLEHVTVEEKLIDYVDEEICKYQIITKNVRERIKKSVNRDE